MPIDEFAAIGWNEISDIKLIKTNDIVACLKGYEHCIVKDPA